MLKRNIVAVIVFASQATLAIAQSSHTMDRRVLSPEDSGYLGGSMQREPAAAGSAPALFASMNLPIATAGIFVGPEDSGYLGGLNQNDRTPERTWARMSAPASQAIARRPVIYPEDSGFPGGV